MWTIHDSGSKHLATLSKMKTFWLAPSIAVSLKQVAEITELEDVVSTEWGLREKIRKNGSMGTNLFTLKSTMPCWIKSWKLEVAPMGFLVLEKWRFFYVFFYWRCLPFKIPHGVQRLSAAWFSGSPFHMFTCLLVQLLFSMCFMQTFYFWTCTSYGFCIYRVLP